MLTFTLTFGHIVYLSLFLQCLTCPLGDSLSHMSHLLCINSLAAAPDGVSVQKKKGADYWWGKNRLEDKNPVKLHHSISVCAVCDVRLLHKHLCYIKCLCNTQRIVCFRLKMRGGRMWPRTADLQTGRQTEDERKETMILAMLRISREWRRKKRRRAGDVVSGHRSVSVSRLWCFIFAAGLRETCCCLSVCVCFCVCESSVDTITTLQ